MRNYLLLRQYLAAAILSIMLFAPMVIASTSTTPEEPTKEEEPVSKSDKECFETCLKNGYDESTCKGVCYSEIKEEKN